MFLFLTSLSTPERLIKLKAILEGTTHLDLKVYIRPDDEGTGRLCIYVETPWNALLKNEDFIQTVLTTLAEAASDTE